LLTYNILLLQVVAVAVTVQQQTTVTGVVVLVEC
jgi:hypothetical protein